MSKEKSLFVCLFLRYCVYLHRNVGHVDYNLGMEMKNKETIGWDGQNCRSQALSRAISWMRFPLIFMIVLLHCYCAIDAHGHPLFFKLVYPFGLWMGETGVPAFFFISGFLFFYSHKTYRKKLRSRVGTLLVPYLFWNGLLLLVLLLMAGLGRQTLIAGKNVLEYGVVDYARAFVDRGVWYNGNGVPVLCPFWYIRNLMVLCLLSPLFYYAIRYLKWVLVLLLFVWWIMTSHNNMVVSSLLFFSMGAYFSVENVNPLSLLQRGRAVFLLAWLSLFVIDWSGHSLFKLPHAIYVHRLSLTFNIFALFLAGAWLGEKKRWCSKLLDRSSFWIYAVHYPLTLVIRDVLARYLGGLSDWQVLGVYFLSVFIVTLVCVISYVICFQLCPRFVAVVTGNRT